MCRLLGITNFNSKEHTGIVRSFFALAETGQVPPGNDPGHKDGWGIGWYTDGKAAIEKSGNSALNEAGKIADTIAAIGSSKVLIAHLRKSAWRDTATARHAHPFAFHNAIFAHNGTLLEYHPLLGGMPPAFAPAQDALDTEVLFRAVLSAPPQALRDKFTETIRTIKACKYRYTALNILLSDGNALIGYRDHAKWPEYYTLYTATLGNADIISSEELRGAGPWVPLDNGQLIVR